MKKINNKTGEDRAARRFIKHLLSSTINHRECGYEAEKETINETYEDMEELIETISAKLPAREIEGE